MGNKYMLWGVVSNLRTTRGLTKYQRNYCITTFTLIHQKDKSTLNIKCKSYVEVVSDMSLKDGDVIELTHYYPKNEKFVSRTTNIESWTQWIIVDDFEKLAYNNAPKQVVQQQTIPQYQPFVPPKNDDLPQPISENPDETIDENLDDDEVVSLDWLSDFSSNPPPKNDDSVDKMREMLKKEQERLNSQPSAPNWNDVPIQDVDIEKVKDGNEW